jgi:hypothetical protein
MVSARYTSPAARAVMMDRKGYIRLRAGVDLQKVWGHSEALNLFNII